MISLTHSGSVSTASHPRGCTFGSGNLPEPPEQSATVVPASSLSWSPWNALLLSLSKPIEIPAVTDVMNPMLTQLMRANGISQPVKVQVVNQSSYNARALSNGVVLLHVGLLQKAKSPEEVAFVLAHEISHMQLQHHERRTQHVIPAGIGGLVASNAMRHMLSLAQRSSKVGRVGVSLVAWLPPLQWVAKHHRDHEMEADRNALRLLTHAGYSPRGYEAFMARGLAWENECERPFWEKARMTLLGRSHPPVSVRKEALDQFQQTQLPSSQLAKPIMSPAEWHILKQAVVSYDVEDQG